MKVSRTGIVLFTVVIAIFSGSCSLYNQIFSRKALVDGAKAYNERKFEEAEELFRNAVSYDPDMLTFEGRTSQLFLARTLHSEYISNRKDTKKANSAIAEYQKAMKGYKTHRTAMSELAKSNPQDEDAKKKLATAEKDLGSISSAVASLYTNLSKDDLWKSWQTKQANDKTMPGVARSKAYISLAAKQYSCANDISDSDEVKSTVTEGDEKVFKFKKPEDEDTFEKLQDCTKQGLELTEKALALDKNSVSGWSYKTSLLLQKSRIAEMEGDNEGRDKFKSESEKAKEKYTELNKKKQAEEQKKADEEAKKKEEQMKEK